MSNQPVFTENGAISYLTTGSARVDFFFKIVRNTPIESLDQLLTASWEEDKLDTMKLIFHLRDCRGGKGEKKQFKECITWLLKKDPQHVINNLHNFTFFGSYKDLLHLFNTEAENEMLKFYSSQLNTDRIAVVFNKMIEDDLNSNEKLNVSLAAKWAPTEGCSHDKKFRAVFKLARALKVDKKRYRKEYLVPIRDYINIVEKLMCANDWNDINYSKVPSVAMNRYRKIFEKHDQQRFAEYLSDVAAGKTKINASVVFPHEIVRSVMDGELGSVLDLQWNALVDSVRQKLSKGGIRAALSVVDVSGSMEGVPMQVAISLGLLLSEISDGVFHHKVITFSESPEMFNIPDLDLRGKVKAMQKMKWGTNTDLMKVFKLLIGTAKLYNLTPEQMPETVFIFSDMQFDAACGCNTNSNYQSIDDEYKLNGYIRPKIVFWNLRGNTVDFPATNSDNIALVSGFSPSLMKLFVDGKEMNPFQVMRRAIDDKRYDCVEL